MDPIKIKAKFVKIEQGWHGQHSRLVARLEVQTEDSPFDVGQPLFFEESQLRGVAVGSRVEIEIRPLVEPAAS